MSQIDPLIPVKIVRDDIDESKINENEMGVLYHPAAASAKVRLVHPGGWEMVCEARWVAVYSKYLRRQLSRFPIPSVVIVDEQIPVDGFVDAMQFINEGEVDVIPSKVFPLLSAAFQLEIPQLQRRLEHYVRVLSNSNESHFLMCWNICYRAPSSVQLREEMMHRAVKMFDTLYGFPEWPLVSNHLIRRLFLRPDLNVKSAKSIFEAALTWIVGNPSVEPATADRIMSSVPFHRMSTIDRMQCLEKAKKMQLVSLVRPRIMLADWHVSCHEAGQENASDLRPPKSDEVQGDRRLQRYQYSDKENTGRASSADQTRSSPAMTSNANPVQRSSSMKNEKPAERQTSQNRPFTKAQEKQKSKAPPGLGKPLRFSSDTRIVRRGVVRHESPVSLHGPFPDIGIPIRFSSQTWVKKLRDDKSSKKAQKGQTKEKVQKRIQRDTMEDWGRPIRFSSSTSVKNGRVAFQSPVALNGPFVDLGTSLRFSAETTIKTFREHAYREKKVQKQVRSKSMLDRGEPICYCSPSIKKDLIDIDKNPNALDGPFVDLGRPIRFSSEIRVKNSRGDGRHKKTPKVNVGNWIRDPALATSEMSEAFDEGSTATVSGRGSSEAFDDKMRRLTASKWQEIQNESEEMSLPTTDSSENALVSATVSAGSKQKTENGDSAVQMGKSVRLKTEAQIKKMLVGKHTAPKLEVEKNDESSSQSSNSHSMAM